MGIYSRYPHEHGEYTIVVGWDRGLLTFFADVFRQDGSEEPVLSTGNKPGQYQDLEAFRQNLQALLNQHSIEGFALPVETTDQLQSDFNEALSGSQDMARPDALQTFLQTFHDQNLPGNE